jgi:hypothetical protein
MRFTKPRNWTTPKHQRYPSRYPRQLSTCLHSLPLHQRSIGSSAISPSLVDNCLSLNRLLKPCLFIFVSPFPASRFSSQRIPEARPIPVPLPTMDDSMMDEEPSFQMSADDSEDFAPPIVRCSNLLLLGEVETRNIDPFINNLFFLEIKSEACRKESHGSQTRKGTQSLKGTQSREGDQNHHHQEDCADYPENDTQEAKIRH